MKPNSARAIHLLLALLVVLLDRWSKRLVAARIPMYTHIQIIPGFFRLTHTENTGAAFSLFADSPSHWRTGLLIGFSVLAMVVVLTLLWKQARALTITGIALSLILGGAVGNL
ncbi:MAG: signal peptidase II, partial [Candidatus Sulfotelmatobacter sp.]